MNKSYSTDFLGIKQDSKILFIYPHPDDETYCNAGLIQKLIRKNIKPDILCLTKGGASTLTFSVEQNVPLTEVRQKEFESVMKYLGVSNYLICDLDDGNLAKENEQAYQLIKASMDTIKPDFVVTYEPTGIYGHPDHIVISKLLTELSKTMPFRLIYCTVGINYKSAESSLKMAENPEAVKPIEPNFELKLTLKEFIKKLNALKQYKSQISVKQEFSHKIYQMFKMLSEYYFITK